MNGPPRLPTTNNEAEYEALVVGLNLAKAAGAASVVLYCTLKSLPTK